jgi:hypothetical protein
MTHDPSLALAADYSDALITARRAKNVLVLLILLMLLGQIALFFTAKYTNYIPVKSAPAATPAGATTEAAVNADAKNLVADAMSMIPTTAPTDAASTSSNLPPTAIEVMQYFVGLTGFFGITLSIVLAIVLLLLTIIMLVGRLIGVARVTSAFIWSLLLIVLLFPWQAFLADAHFASDFKIPGVLFTWVELVKFAKVGVDGASPGIETLILHWARFVVFPVATVVITLLIQFKSSRGLREALGEVDAVAAVPTA